MSENVRVPTYLSFPKINTESVVIDHKVIQEELSKYYNSQDGAVEYGNKLLKEFKTANRFIHPTYANGIVLFEKHS